jgi:DNA-binding NarL/FixJ family response regulator
VRTLFYPVAVWTLCDFINFDPAEIVGNRQFAAGGGEYPVQRPPRNRRESELMLERKERWEIEAVQKPLGTFACRECHGIKHISGADAGSWNLLIGHLTAGLLYGHEVRPPAWYKPGEDRKRRRIRQLMRQAPRREQVMRRLMNGKSVRWIARDLQINKSTVERHIRILCEQEGVADRHELVAKRGGANSPPLNQEERAAKRRFAVMEMILGGCSYRQIMERLGVDFSTVNRDTNAIYKMYGVGGKGWKARRELAGKMGREVAVSAGELVRERIGQLRERGLEIEEIAERLGLERYTVKNQLAKLRREERARPKPEATPSEEMLMGRHLIVGRIE